MFLQRAIAVGTTAALLVALQVALPANACACGAPAPIPGTEVTVERETSIVRWDGAREEIIMQLNMISSAGETGLVVPTPTPAQVTAGDAEVFDAVLIETAPREVISYDWWGAGPFDGLSAGAPGDASTPPVVLERVQLGPIEATTLAASDAQGLSDWLDQNGYELAPAVAEELAPYVVDGWSFVAIKLTGEVPFDGELDPIRFTFDSDSLVYPMRMSRAAESEQSVRLYVFDEHRATVTGTDGSLAITPDVYWAAPVASPALRELGSFLTVIDLNWQDPQRQITGDVAISQAESDSSVIPTYTTTEIVNVAGVPAGYFLVAIALVVVLGAIVIAVALRRRAHRG